MSVSLSDRGFIPLGTLLAGIFAQNWGIQAAFSAYGMYCLSIILTIFVIYYYIERKEILQ